MTMQFTQALENFARWNKGTAFTQSERAKLKLEGLLPATIDTLDRQVERVLGHLAAKPDDLEKYIYLQELCDRNETLFYATLMSDPAGFVPIVYDPTIADACLTATSNVVCTKRRGNRIAVGIRGMLGNRDKKCHLGIVTKRHSPVKASGKGTAVETAGAFPLGSNIGKRV